MIRGVRQVCEAYLAYEIELEEFRRRLSDAITSNDEAIDVALALRQMEVE